MEIRKENDRCFRRWIINGTRIILTLIIPLSMSGAGLLMKMSGKLHEKKLFCFLLDLVTIWFENTFLLYVGTSIFLFARSFNASYSRYLGFLFLGMFSVFCALFAVSDFLYEYETGGLVPDFNLISSGVADIHVLFANLNTMKDNMVGQNITIVFAGYLQGVMVYCVSYRFTFSFLPNLMRSEYILFILLCPLIFLYCFWGWAPITNMSLCMIGTAGTAFFPEIGSEKITNFAANPVGAEKIANDTQHMDYLQVLEKKLNVILVVQESTSGLLVNTEQGKAAMPFFHSEVSSIPNAFIFENARAVAGTTTIATPGILTGMVPFTEAGQTFAYNGGLAKFFQSHNYSTAIFSSYKTYWNFGWTNMNGLLNDGYDKIFDPPSTGEPLVNDHGMDDRVLMAKYFAPWVQNQTQPFYAVLIWNNNHFPHFTNNQNITDNFQRYYASLRTTDECVSTLFNTLKKQGILKDTFVAGAGDHGETPGLKYKRLGDLDCAIMHVPMWMHLPSSVPLEEKQLLQLRTRNIVSVMDILPTLGHVLGITVLKPTVQQDCLVGQNLLSSTYPKNRIAMGWMGDPIDNKQLAVFNYEKKAFIVSSKSPHNTREVIYQINHTSPLNQNLTMINNFSPEQKQFWKNLLEPLHNEPFILQKVSVLHSLLGIDVGEHQSFWNTLVKQFRCN